VRIVTIPTFVGIITVTGVIVLAGADRHDPGVRGHQRGRSLVALAADHRGVHEHDRVIRLVLPGGSSAALRGARG
jgi:hypothetical protein